MKQFSQSKEDAISRALVQSSEKKESVLVIYVHGEGHRIVDNDFDLNRFYYHGKGGRKTFFTYIAEVFPGGLVNYNEKAA